MPTARRSTLALGGSRWAVRRARWRALGPTDEDMTELEVADGAVPTPGGAGAAAPAGDLATSGGAR